MKKIFLLFVCCLLAAATQAQTEKGSWLVGGNMWLSASGNKNTNAATTTKTNNFYQSLSVFGGHFITNNWALGLSLGESTNRSIEAKGQPNERTYRTASVSAGIFTRYYFSIDEKFKLYGHLGAHTSKNTNKTETANGTITKISGTANSLSVGVGANYFLTSKAALDLNLSTSDVQLGLTFFLR